MDILQEKLGKSLSPQEVADFLQIDIKTVRKYYLHLGGVRLGKSYRFFERRLVNAIQAREKLGCTNPSERKEIPPNVSDETGSDRMGGKEEKIIKANFRARDTHGLLD
jgi:hypothetical protein